MDTDTAHPAEDYDFLTLKETSQILSVSIETLIEWNENNILKPTITQEGTVVYKKEQINRFIEAQKTLKDATALRYKTSDEQNLAQTPLPASFHNSDKLISPNMYETKKTGRLIPGRSYAFAALASFAFTLFAFAVISSVGQKNPAQSLLGNTPLSPEAEKNISVLNPQSEEIDLTNSNNKSIGLSVEGRKTKEEDPAVILNAEENLPALHGVFQNEAATHAGHTDDREMTPPAEESDIYEVRPRTPEYNAQGSLASKPNTSGTNSNTDLLAISLDTNDPIRGNEPAGSKTLPTILIFLFSVGAVSVIFMFRKQLLFSYSSNSTLKTDVADTVPFDLINNEPVEKIIGVDQKMDGTVILNFQEKEYKISKPELGSESDQLIERLLEYAPNEVQEISYSIIEDKKISLNAPLSKIVTRLGFVGLKRELFFPRTSKNSVLFRRYLTRSDLDSMNISTDQIVSEFIN